MRLVYFTICARNYLAYALTLRASLLAAVPEATFVIFLADAPIDGAPPAPDIVDARALALPDHDDMAMRYDVMEFATAIKPFCFFHLFDRMGADRAIYLDPDIAVFAPLALVEERFAVGAEAVLIPHLRAPTPDDGEAPTTTEIWRSGAYNLGFIAFANQTEPRRFLDWWAGECALRCFSDPQRGLFVDQKFAEMVPSLVGRTTILRDPAYNVAYWNLHERRVTQDSAGRFLVDGAPLRFFHFSGVAPADSSVFSKHQTRFKIAELGAVKDLVEDYRARLADNGQARWSAVPYAFGSYTDGTPIPRAARRLYAREGARTTAPPFILNLDALNAPASDVDQSPARITRLMAQIWRDRPDLQEAFPLAAAAGRAGFQRWCLLHGASEAQLSSSMLAPAARSGAGRAISWAGAARRLLPASLRDALRRRSRARRDAER